MFKYFPTNYVWNLSVNLAIEMGARIGEIEVMCAPLLEAAKAPDAAGTKAFREAWVKMADQLCELANEDLARGREISAGEKLRRASAYLITAERLQAHDALGRMDLYRRLSRCHSQEALETLQKDMADDGLHPNAGGYKVMAALVQSAIDRVLPTANSPVPPEKKRRGPFGILGK